MSLILRIFVVVTCMSPMVLCRGPHHPRGSSVKKHTHYKPTKGHAEKITQDAKLLHDKEHLKEHLEEVIDAPDLSKMSDEELEFYYFQVHDTDKNSKLDGLEILQAIMHIEDLEDENAVEYKQDFSYYVELIDEVLHEDDLDHDGFLTYPEYVNGRKRKLAQNINNAPAVKMIP